LVSGDSLAVLGRRACLIGGAFGLFVVNLIAPSVYEAARAHPDRASSFAPATVAMFFLFNICYVATWGTVAFLVPTKI
jgi:hypothetical protein